MNKKAYITPEMEYILMDNDVQLLAGSDFISINGDEDPSVSPGGSDAPFMNMEDSDF